MVISLSDFEKVVNMSKFYVHKDEEQDFIKYLDAKINLLQKTFRNVELEDDFVFPKEQFYQCFVNDKVKNDINTNNNEGCLLDKRKTRSFFIKNV